MRYEEGPDQYATLTLGTCRATSILVGIVPDERTLVAIGISH